MSCTLKEIASIEDLSGLLSWLCPKFEQFQEYDSSKSGFNETKSDEDNLSEKPETGLEEKHEQWLDECSVALSPTVDLMALAYRNRMAILKSQYERVGNGEKKNLFSVTWKGVLGHWQIGDEITSVLCLPIVSQKQSSSGAPDWTTVVVGYKSGFISFYTEGGLLLLSQLFHESAVVDLSVRTYVAKNFGTCVYSDLSEELVVLYPKCVVSIDGFGLLQTLKVCRNQVAKASAIGEDIPTMTSLGYKKWNLSQQEEVTGCISSGMLPPHLYDHVMLMSNLNGFSQGIPGAVPTTSLMLTVGCTPYFSSYSIKEGAAPPFIADIAHHYASKLKNALLSAASGWIFGNKSEEGNKKERPRIEQPISIPFRYTLPDKRRLGLSIQLSRSRRLAAITDDFGRVNLLDVQKCIILRMLKGYRDAECGWVNVIGEVAGAKREVPFLIIYAPRRNLLEVWLPQHGPRVAAFNVAKKSKLIHTPHTLLGANTQQGSSFRTIHSVLMTSQGTLEQLSIPFHLALSGKTSKQARDIHLLKSVKMSLRNKPVAEILRTIKEMKTCAIKVQLISMLAGSKYTSVELVRQILEELSNVDGGVEGMESGNQEKVVHNIDHETRLLSQQLSRLTQLLQLYALLSSLHSESLPEDRQGVESEDKRMENLSGRLKLSKAEEDQLLWNIKNDDELRKNKAKKVTFTEEGFNFSSFLQCFDIGASLEKEQQKCHRINLRKNLTKEMETALGKYIFGWSYSPSRIKCFALGLKTSAVEVSDLLNLSFSYWLSLEVVDKQSILHFLNHWLIIAVFSEPGWCSSNQSELRPVWVKVREELNCWCLPFHAYVAALSCRAVESAFLVLCNKDALKKTEEVESVDELSILDELIPVNSEFDDVSHNHSIKCDPRETWEDLSLEIVEWNLIANKLEKLVSVQRIHMALARRENVRNIYNNAEYSIKVFYQKGKGYLSELIAQWFIESNLSIEQIIKIIRENDPAQETDNEQISDDVLPSGNLEENEDEFLNLKELFRNVRRYFTNSTKADVVLVNISWELASLWKKSPNVVYLYSDSVSAFKGISSGFLKHGVCFMMWETWIVHFVVNATRLFDKISRRPKDRLSLRNIGISELNLGLFFSLTKELLEIIMTTSVACEIDHRPAKLEKDEFWKEVELFVPSLADVTLAQMVTSCDLTFLHQQLVCVLRLVYEYELRNVKPSFLFPERDRASLFKPLSCSWRLTSDEGREVVSNSQLTFINKVVSAAVVGLPDATSGCDIETPSGVYDAIELGRCWGVSLDAIRRHYVCELYSSGLDTIAEQSLIMVRDGVMVASQMMVIAGQRLHYLITSSPKSIESTALITPNIKEWCSTLDHGCLRCPDVPVRQTLKMVNKALLLIPELNGEYKVATNLLRALKMIHEADL